MTGLYIDANVIEKIRFTSLRIEEKSKRNINQAKLRCFSKYVESTYTAVVNYLAYKMSDISPCCVAADWFTVQICVF